MGVERKRGSGWDCEGSLERPDERATLNHNNCSTRPIGTCSFPNLSRVLCKVERTTTRQLPGSAKLHKYTAKFHRADKKLNLKTNCCIQFLRKLWSKIFGKKSTSKVELGKKKMNFTVSITRSNQFCKLCYKNFKLK